MASAISKKEIRRNPLAEWVGAAVRFVQTHRFAFVAAAMLVAIGVSGAAFYWYYQQRQEEEASRILGNAFAAIRKEQPRATGNSEDAAKLFQEVVKQFPKTGSAEEALIALGNVQYEAGQIDEAAASFDQYLRILPRGRFTLQAGLGKAYALEAKGDPQGAAQTLSEVLERNKQDPLAGEAYMSLARLYEILKKPDDATRLYGQVVETYPQTRWAQNALQRLTALKAN